MPRRKTIDIGEAPLYGVPEAAFFLDISVATLRSWVEGRVYDTSAGPKFFHPLIDIADRLDHRMSFYNLVEAHVLVTFRQHYKIPMPRIRDAMDYLRGRIDHKHPLITQDFYVHGQDILIKQLGANDRKETLAINASRKGQLAIKEVLEIYLRRIRRTKLGLPARLHPMKQGLPLRQPEVIEINPNVAFGNPVLAGTNMTVAMILERHALGMTAREIARDFDVPLDEVKTTIACYGRAAA